MWCAKHVTLAEVDGIEAHAIWGESVKANKVASMTRERAHIKKTSRGSSCINVGHQSCAVLSKVWEQHVRT